MYRDELKNYNSEQQWESSSFCCCCFLVCGLFIFCFSFSCYFFLLYYTFVFQFNSIIMNNLLVSDCLNSDYIILNVLVCFFFSFFILRLHSTLFPSNSSPYCISHANESVWITRNLKLSCPENFHPLTIKKYISLFSNSNQFYIIINPQLFPFNPYNNSSCLYQSYRSICLKS